MSDESDVIDLTSSPEAEKPRWMVARLRSSSNFNEPIGINMTFDVVDLIDDSQEKPIAHPRPEPTAMKKPANQTHPLKIIEASKKCKREREEARRREEEARRKAELERRAEELRKQKAEEVRQKNLANQVNFIMIDDDSSADEQEDDNDSSYARMNSSAPEGNAEPLKPAARAASVGPTREWVYHNPAARKKRKQPINASRRRATSPEEDPPFVETRDFNYAMSHEDAAQLQERMFQEAAARLRARAPSPSRVINGTRCFQRPILNIHDQFPEHWQWKEPWSCLGLPPNSSITLVKTHYRALARLYHPDKSKEANTTRKFQGIARAYHRLTVTGAAEHER